MSKLFPPVLMGLLGVGCCGCGYETGHVTAHTKVAWELKRASVDPAPEPKDSLAEPATTHVAAAMLNRLLEQGEQDAAEEAAVALTEKLPESPAAWALLAEIRRRQHRDARLEMLQHELRRSESFRSPVSRPTIVEPATPPLPAPPPPAPPPRPTPPPVTSSHRAARPSTISRLAAPPAACRIGQVTHTDGRLAIITGGAADGVPREGQKVGLLRPGSPDRYLGEVRIVDRWGRAARIEVVDHRVRAMVGDTIVLSGS